MTGEASWSSSMCRWSLGLSFITSFPGSPSGSWALRYLPRSRGRAHLLKFPKAKPNGWRNADAVTSLSQPREKPGLLWAMPLLSLRPICQPLPVSSGFVDTGLFYTRSSILESYCRGHKDHTVCIHYFGFNKCSNISSNFITWVSIKSKLEPAFHLFILRFFDFKKCFWLELLMEARPSCPCYPIRITNSIR